MHVVALIPARGGSKGLPGKNLATVGGHSLIARAALCAQLATSVDACVVSSDDDQILSEAAAAGAEALRRPADLAGDDTPSIEVVRHVIGSLAADMVVLLQPTSPFRAPSDIDDCVAAAGASGSAATVCEVEHPVEWTFSRSENGALDIPSSGIPLRRQGAQPQVRLCGSVYASGIERLRSGAALVDETTIGVLVPRARAIDIDEQFDLDVAQSLAGTAHDPLTGAAQPTRTPTPT